MPDRYQANIGFPGRKESFDVEVETISDGFQKALIKHEFANTNGALLEDMGQKGRSISIRIYFLGDAYYQHHIFLDALDDSGPVELTHPIYGLLKGGIEKVDVRHKDLLRTAEIDLTFVEGRIDAVTRAETSMPGAVENSFLDGQDEQQDGLAGDVAGDLGTEGASAAAKTLDGSKGLLEQYNEVSGKVRAYVAQVDAAVSRLEATMNLIAQPANSLLATVQFAQNLPGRVIGSVARCVERYAESYNALRNFPARFQRSLTFSLDQLEGSFRSFRSKAPAGSSRNLSETAAMTMIANHINLAASHRLALEAAYGFANDQANRSAAKKNEGQRSFDLLGNYFAPVPSGPIMTVTEIEAALAAAMAAAQASVDLDRGGTRAIKSSIAALVDYARKTKLQAEKIKQVDIDGTLPIHLICLKYGLPYNAAERVLAINPRIRHPNFVSGTINIYSN